jgi:hypothetical protein
MFTCYLATLQNCWLTGKSAVAKMGLQGKNYDFDSDDINSYHSFPNSFWHFAGCYWDSILLNLLVQKELVSCKNSKRAQLLGKALNIGIIPLLLASMMLIAYRMMEVLY